MNILVYENEMFSLPAEFHFNETLCYLIEEMFLLVKPFLGVNEGQNTLLSYRVNVSSRKAFFGVNEGQNGMMVV